MNCIDGMKLLNENSIDAVVTDPPYHLSDPRNATRGYPARNKEGEWDNEGRIRAQGGKGFMGMKWDGGDISFNVDLWREVMRVIKPGGHLLSFGGSRTYHRMAVAVEDAGFEIRDMINWLYGSGFPKSLNISKAIDSTKGAEREVIGKGYGKSYVTQNRINKERGFRPNDYYEDNEGEFDITVPSSPEAKEWSGFGTALKPAHEPIVLARKPLSENTVTENVLKWGTGGLNIDGCRIATKDDLAKNYSSVRKSDDVMGERGYKIGFRQGKDSIANATESTALGRFPANLIHDGSDEVEEVFAKAGESKSSPVGFKGVAWKHSGNTKDKRTHLEYQREFNDSGSASRFFYTAKADKEERDMGLSIVPTNGKRATPMAGRGQGGLKCKICNKWKNSGNPCTCKKPDFEEVKFNSKANLNIHPTVKPLELMRYLVKLVTREEQLVLDPFIGSGTTAIACRRINRHFIGFEISQEYVDIANKRLKTIPGRLEDFS